MCLYFHKQQLVMANFCVISIIGRRDLNFPVGLMNKYLECLCASAIIQLQVITDILISTRVHRRVNVAAGLIRALVLAVSSMYK